MTKFVDAQEKHRIYPKTFEVPTDKELADIKVGDIVKICPECQQSERFWVNVTEIGKDKLKGTVDNDLIFTHEHGLKFQDEVEFETKNIYSIYYD